MSSSISQLIINSPYTEPSEHWGYDRETQSFVRREGRRPAGYVKASEKSKAFDDPGVFVEIPLVNAIRPRVKKWREAGYPGVSGITKRLLEHWNDADARENSRFFFCQIEAMETLIWLAEAPDAEKVGITVPSDGGAFTRLCAKMATGSGKTIVMAMTIAWQVLNKVAYPQDARFSKNVFVVAPGLTVKNRLAVLIPSGEGNYYDAFNIVPETLREKLRQGKVIVNNWHTLNWESDEKIKKRKSVDKRGAKSDEAYAREVLVDMQTARNILVINDEAHHAWRIPADATTKDFAKDDLEEATKWVGGLDRIHAARGIQTCYDFTATPFVPSGKRSSEETLYKWIVSDFGLNDAIESGLVKTPRVVIRDDGMPDAKTYKSKLYHIYEHERDDLNQKAEPHTRLPRLVTNAYTLLGKDWLKTKEDWKAAGNEGIPVMITVANRTETAARVKYALDHNRIDIKELCDASRTLHIDTKVLNEAEALADDTEQPEFDFDADDDSPRKMSKKDRAIFLRRQVDTIGQKGQPGGDIQCVISVGMLTEGWDAKTVTHIMGLRAFSSQLLCEQVVGRGLRRTSYEVNPETGMFQAEYVNIFGVPFTFLPHEQHDGPPPPPPSPKTRIEVEPARNEFEISWPNVVRVDHVLTPRLSLNLEKFETLVLDTSDYISKADLAPIIDGKTDSSKILEIEAQAGTQRLQSMVFEASARTFDMMRSTWKGGKEYLLGQLIELIDTAIKARKISLVPASLNDNEKMYNAMLKLHVDQIVEHIAGAITFQNTQEIKPIFDTERPIRSTADMQPWYTGKPCAPTKRSHINKCVFDSTWESNEAYEIDTNKNVKAWAKNDHLGFEIAYHYDGAFHKYRPDFIITLADGTHLILETKGQETEQDRVKRKYLEEWISAINAHGGFGTWRSAVSRHVKDVAGIVLHRS